MSMKLVILVFWSIHSFHLKRILMALLLKHEGDQDKYFVVFYAMILKAFTTYVRPLLEFCTTIWSPSLVGMIEYVVLELLYRVYIQFVSFFTVRQHCMQCRALY